MVRTKKYKFVYTPTDVDELYDLELDPFELNNLAGQSELSKVKEALYILMWQEAADVGDIIFNKGK